MDEAQTPDSDYILITETPLNLQNLTNKVSLPSCGGVSVFIGITRDNFHGRPVRSLEYECYKPMAVKELKKIVEDMRAKWPDIAKVAVAHRLGLVPVTEASVIIAVGAPHRASAMHATEYCIDNLKATVPIWKKELFEDGETEWKANQECKWKS